MFAKPLQTWCILQSSTVVGYNETGLREGGKGVGASFVNVGAPTTAIDLQDLKIVSNEEAIEGTVTASILDRAGRTVATYFWYDIPDELYGWLDITDEFAEGVKLQPGEALSFSAPDDTYAVKSAGEVPTTGIAVQLREGGKRVCNPTPVAIDINDEDNGVTITSNEEAIEGTVTASILDRAGRTVSTYFWYDIPGELYGWLDITDEFAEGVIMQPGESMSFSAPDNTYYVNFPGVKL